MKIADIAANLVATLQAAQDEDSEPLFVDVLAQPQGDVEDFTGFPSCTAFYSNTTSDYATVNENRRTVEFNVFIYLVRESTTLAQKYQQMYSIVDIVLDAIDKSSDLSLPDAFVRPAPGEFARETTERGEALIAQVRVVVWGDTPSNNG